MTSSVAGKQAIVTGAGSGIGAALCRALAGAGAEVLCTDIDEDAAARTATALGARSARLDVTDATAVQAAVDGVVERAGQLDLMFNNAGIVWGGDTELLTLEQWNKAILIKPRRAHASWLFARVAPGLMQRLSMKFVASQRAGQAARRSASGTNVTLE